MGIKLKSQKHQGKIRKQPEKKDRNAYLKLKEKLVLKIVKILNVIRTCRKILHSGSLISGCGFYNYKY